MLAVGNAFEVASGIRHGGHDPDSVGVAHQVSTPSSGSCQFKVERRRDCFGHHDNFNKCTHILFHGRRLSRTYKRSRKLDVGGLDLQSAHFHGALTEKCEFVDQLCALEVSARVVTTFFSCFPVRMLSCLYID